MTNEEQDTLNYLRAIQQVVESQLSDEEKMRQVADLVAAFQQLKKTYATKR